MTARILLFVVATSVVACGTETEDAEFDEAGGFYRLDADDADCDLATAEPLFTSDGDLCTGGGCACDCTAATLACRAIPACGAGAVAAGKKGNTCTNSDCRNNAGCDCETCTSAGVVCGTVATAGACVKP